jgi:4-hydroxy-3-methylbut-2-en-1-yl diphosphate synthase IspG/GcpE
VEFVAAIVLAQYLDTLAFSDVDFSAKLNAMKKNVGVYINMRQATANKQV